ncbi:MAG: hypothetical protein ABSE07_02020 [Methanoregula sp.]
MMSRSNCSPSRHGYEFPLLYQPGRDDNVLAIRAWYLEGVISRDGCTILKVCRVNPAYPDPWTRDA